MRPLIASSCERLHSRGWSKRSRAATGAPSLLNKRKMSSRSTSR